MKNEEDVPDTFEVLTEKQIAELDKQAAVEEMLRREREEVPTAEEDDLFLSMERKARWADSSECVAATDAQDDPGVYEIQERPPVSPAAPPKIGQFFRRRHHFVPCFIAVAALLIAPAEDLPYAYYIFLRFIVTGLCVWLLWLTPKYYASAWARGLWCVPFCVVAIFFNPIMPIHLEPEEWLPIDIAAFAFFVLTAMIYRKTSGDA